MKKLKIFRMMALAVLTISVAALGACSDKDGGQVKPLNDEEDCVLYADGDYHETETTLSDEKIDEILKSGRWSMGYPSVTTYHDRNNYVREPVYDPYTEVGFNLVTFFFDKKWKKETDVLDLDLCDYSVGDGKIIVRNAAVIGLPFHLDEESVFEVVGFDGKVLVLDYDVSKNTTAPGGLKQNELRVRYSWFLAE